ncbi:MAG: type II toxin-antitoxin system VapB family antitoxin [Chloroflexota bacterium]
MAHGRKTTLNLDETLLRQAQDILGSQGIKETIDLALREVVTARARRRTIERLTNLDCDADEIRSSAWGRE